MSPKELEIATWAGTRDWNAYPPSPDEVRRHIRERELMASQRIMVSYNGAGFSRAFAMIDAEKRFKAMGLL